MTRALEPPFFFPLRGRSSSSSSRRRRPGRSESSSSSSLDLDRDFPLDFVGLSGKSRFSNGDPPEACGAAASGGSSPSLLFDRLFPLDFAGLSGASRLSNGDLSEAGGGSGGVEETRGTSPGALAAGGESTGAGGITPAHFGHLTARPANSSFNENAVEQLGQVIRIGIGPSWCGTGDD
jgi:hypothetical protein